MSRRAVVFLLCVAPAIAQPKFSVPLVGIARDSQQQLRIVHGVSGTFVLHDVIGKNAVDWAFDGNGGLVNTGSELLTLGADGTVIRRRPVAQQEAVLGPQNAFFPETAELWQTGPQGDSKVPIAAAMIAGRVIALGPTKAHAVQLAVCRANAFWLLAVDATNGAITQELTLGGAIAEQACLAAGGGSLVLLPDRRLLATAHAILIQTAAGVERSIPIAAGHLVRAGEQWIEVEKSGEPAHMIRITREGEKVYQLPAAKERP